MKKTLSYILIFCLAVSLWVGGCACQNTQPTTKDNNCLTIICTTYAAKEIATALTQNWTTLPEGHGYDALQIQILGQGGRDLHSYEPTAADLVSLHNADVFVYIGESAEPWVGSALQTVNMAEGVAFDMMDACHDSLLPAGHDSSTCTPDHDHDHDSNTTYDEHIWMSLKNMMTLTQAMGEQLQTIAPHAKDLIEANQTAYVAKLQALDTQYTDMVAGAQRQEVLVADRNPFVYLMHDYGITCHAAFPGCSSETEASFATQTMLLETVKTQKLPYILQTEGGESTIAKTIAEATGAGVLTLNACQIMTNEQRFEVTYLEIMENNLETLKKALWAEPLS